MVKLVSTLTVATVMLFSVAALAKQDVCTPLAAKKATGNEVADAVRSGNSLTYGIGASAKFADCNEAGATNDGSAAASENGDIQTNDIGMQFALIPAGAFVMGSPDGSNPTQPAEMGRLTKETQHVVTLTHPYYMQTTEVTQGQWIEVLGSNPSYFASCGLDCPVEKISWNDAQAFIAALNAREGRTGCDAESNNCYSLPTEAQWEYAARAGSTTAFYSGDITNTECAFDANLDAIGWYCGNSGSETSPAAQKAPNKWGLYDMSGNVWEWCSDFYAPYSTDSQTDPTGPENGWGHIARGGSWGAPSQDARSAYRTYNTPGTSYNTTGFRLVLPAGN